MRIAYLFAALAGVSALSAAELVGVPGSYVQYPASVEVAAAGKAANLTLTGTAMRTKIILNVYAVGSYVEAGSAVKTPEDVIALDRLKRLHLVMERTVEGKDLAEAFRSAVRMNHPEPEFNDEVGTLVSFMRSTAVRKGEHIYLTHVPGIGLHCSVAGKADFLIKNPKFSAAVWEIYLGKNNLGEALKKGLVSRL
ncbi:MAG: chalcone isomerase family protein [Gemmataceae bacterium]